MGILLRRCGLRETLKVINGRAREFARLGFQVKRRNSCTGDARSLLVKSRRVTLDLRMPTCFYSHVGMYTSGDDRTCTGGSSRRPRRPEGSGRLAFPYGF